MLEIKNKSPLRIGYIWQYESTSLPPVSATALHIKSIIESFERKGHKVRLLSIRNSRPSYSDDRESWIPLENDSKHLFGFRIIEKTLRGLQRRLNLPYLNLFDSYRFAHACLTALQECDIFYERFWLLASGGAIASRWMGVPIIYEINGDIVEEYSQLGIQLPTSHWAAIHMITRQMFKQSARLITVSDRLRENTIERWRTDPSKVTTILNGANLDLISNSDKSNKPKYGLKNDTMVVIFVSSFKPWHGLDLLVEAFHHVSSLIDNVKLLLVGDGPVRHEIENLVERLNLSEMVIFTGGIDQKDVASLLSIADVAIINPRLSPAFLAQCPLKLFEYMAAGKPIVAPSTPTINQVLAHRENALLVLPDSCEDLSNAIFELLQDKQLRLKLGRAARKQAFQRHSWDHTVTELEKVFYNKLEKNEPLI
jgi:glycosyltransferase involved in cell wall biosynthesis